MSNKKIFNYYVEVYHRELDQNYIMQSKFFEEKEEAIEFAKNFLTAVEYLDKSLGFDLMACYGDEENYDIIVIGYFEKNGQYVQTYQKELFQIHVVFTNGDYEHWSLRKKIETLEEAKVNFEEEVEYQLKTKNLICSKGCYVALTKVTIDDENEEIKDFEILQTKTIK